MLTQVYGRRNRGYTPRGGLRTLAPIAYAPSS
jgi:hypothetical protein